MRPAVTADRTPIAVFVNIGDSAEVETLDPACCDGIGLVRTEFLFSRGLPDQETQYRVYRRLAEWAAGKPVTIRTLDAGAEVTPCTGNDDDLDVIVLLRPFERSVEFGVDAAADSIEQFRVINRYLNDLAFYFSFELVFFLRQFFLQVAHGATSPGVIIVTLPCARNDFNQSTSSAPTSCCNKTSSIRFDIVSTFGGVTFRSSYSGTIFKS